MIFPEKKSALVRLSDCIKLGIGNCLDTTLELINLHIIYKEPISKIKAIAQEILNDRIAADDGERMLLEINKNIPEKDATRAVSLQGRLSSESLTVILNCCFTLESYVNSLGFYLFKEKDYLGLLRGGHESTAELLFDAIEKMSTIAKWETLGKLKKGHQFDRSKSPFQDLKILFNFRNDIVHDKVVNYSDDRVTKRYNNKLLDPIFGFLTLNHVIYAVDTYWGIIIEIHNILGTNMKDFHKHYNLKPWFDNNFEDRVRKASQAYESVTFSFPKS